MTYTLRAGGLFWSLEKCEAMTVTVIVKVSVTITITILMTTTIVRSP